jgi:hypothetical protein
MEDSSVYQEASGRKGKYQFTPKIKSNEGANNRIQ